MISDFLNYYILEKLDKQIINKIPYCLFFSLVIYIERPFIETIKLKFINLLLYLKFPQLGIIDILLLSLIIFIISTYTFNWYINRGIENSFYSIDFRNFRNKMSQIFEGKSSILEDINNSENYIMFFLAILSGFFLTVLLVISFLILLNLYPIKKELIIVGIVFVSMYLFQDAIKSTASGDFKEEMDDKSPLLTDMMERYAISNSLEQIHGKILQHLLPIFSRILGPIVHLSIPKFSFNKVMIYKNPDVVKLFKDLLDDNKIKYIEGYPLEKFFNEEKGEQLIKLIEKSPKETYPYILDPNYSYNDNEQRKKKWIAFKIINEGTNEASGYIFIHLFKGFFMKRKLKNGTPVIKKEGVNKGVYLITFIGNRNFIEYLKYQIETISIKVPLEIINIEHEDSLNDYSSR
ncbi:MAG: hypothetical protein SCH70_06845 [Candidatus Methanoperedens sp.]|nr:hypothetical protein [Candidatus Methanoperedens sp.]